MTFFTSSMVTPHFRAIWAMARFCPAKQLLIEFYFKGDAKRRRWPLIILLMRKKTFCHVYIFCLLNTLVTLVASVEPIFSPAIQSNIVALPYKPILWPCHLAQFCYPAIWANFESNNICLIHNCSAFCSRFMNCIYFSPPLNLKW